MELGQLGGVVPKLGEGIRGMLGGVEISLCTRTTYPVPRNSYRSVTILQKSMLSNRFTTFFCLLMNVTIIIELTDCYTPVDVQLRKLSR